jgi:hypothetical protein
VCAFLFEQCFALFAIDMSFVPDNIGGFNFCQDGPPVEMINEWLVIGSQFI